jgi:hypothetical protein
MDQLLSMAPSNEKASTHKVVGDPASAFTLPSDVKATMTKEDLLALKCFPGYFEPMQTSIGQGSGMLREETYHTVNTIICIDDDMWTEYVMTFGYFWWLADWEGCCEWANSILEGGDDYLESPFEIDFQTDTANYCYWTTPSGDSYSQLLDTLDQVDPTGIGDDVLVCMSGQSDPNYAGMANQFGRHFIMHATASLPANIFQHEASHLFDCGDHGWDWTYCIMSYNYAFSYRGYCTGCTTQLELNCDRFD